MEDVDSDRGGPGRPPRAGAVPPDAPVLLDALVESMVDHAIVVLDPEGCIRSWNPGAERLTGYRSADVLGRPIAVLAPGGDAAVTDQDLAVAVADGHHEEEGWRVREDGTRFWASVVTTALRGDDGRLLGFGMIFRDLTDRRRGEEALRESEERFRLLVSGVADYAIFLLDNDGRVASWNLGAERLKGYQADEIIGRSFANFYTEEDRFAGVPETALLEADATGRWSDEGWRVRKDGTRFWASVVITRLVGRDGSRRGFAKVTRDLTERKRGEDALRGILERERDTAEQLRAVDRIRSDLVSSVAHDLRAPVGLVQSYLELLRADWAASSDDDKLATLDLVTQRMGALAALVDDVFDLVRIDAGHLEVSHEPFDLPEVVVEAIEAGRTASPGVEVRSTIEGPVVALGDRRRTWQIVSNLVSNAVKYTLPDTAVDVGVAARGAHVEVVVTDQGPGIAADQQEAIFDRFTRLPGTADRPGSGLGLFIARSLAAAQGGGVEVESTPGAGATFRLWLHAAKDVGEL